MPLKMNKRKSSWADPYLGMIFDGSIDDVRIYNRALSAHEVSVLYGLNNNTNNAPENLSSVSSLSIVENQPVGTVVGEFNATDSDAGATLTYSLVSEVGFPIITCLP